MNDITFTKTNIKCIKCSKKLELLDYFGQEKFEDTEMHFSCDLDLIYCEDCQISFLPCPECMKIDENNINLCKFMGIVTCEPVSRNVENTKELQEFNKYMHERENDYVYIGDKELFYFQWDGFIESLDPFVGNIYTNWKCLICNSTINAGAL